MRRCSRLCRPYNTTLQSNKVQRAPCIRHASGFAANHEGHAENYPCATWSESGSTTGQAFQHLMVSCISSLHHKWTSKASSDPTAYQCKVTRRCPRLCRQCNTTLQSEKVQRAPCMRHAANLLQPMKGTQTTLHARLGQRMVQQQAECLSAFHRQVHILHVPDLFGSSMHVLAAKIASLSLSPSCSLLPVAFSIRTEKTHKEPANMNKHEQILHLTKTSDYSIRKIHQHPSTDGA